MVKKNINLLLMIILLLLQLLPHASGHSCNDTPTIDGPEIFVFVCGLLTLLALVIYTCAGIWSICNESIHNLVIDLRRIRLTALKFWNIVLGFRNNSVTTETATDNGGLDQKVIETFPEIVYSALKNKGNVPEKCAICLYDYEVGDMLRFLPCDHSFHTGCIDNWLVSHGTTCPYCRYNLQAIVPE
ncbi:hypothetical protein MKW94_026597 [Papaver nudicaule]|uniref:RING-type domain-containing protein n=1 Tax=Papaver nudicaule TaxID=74823 RepID=A0AA41VNW0_PAPNU|nr:hypothetical protein [Papaver nudicaule]